MANMLVWIFEPRVNNEPVDETIAVYNSQLVAYGHLPIEVESIRTIYNNSGQLILEEARSTSDPTRTWIIRQKQLRNT